MSQRLTEFDETRPEADQGFGKRASASRAAASEHQPVARRTDAASRKAKRNLRHVTKRAGAP